MLPSVTDLLEWGGTRPPLPDTALAVAVAVRACADFIGVELDYQNLQPAARGEWAFCALTAPVMFAEIDGSVVVGYRNRGISIPPSVLWRHPAAVQAAFAALFCPGDHHD